MINLHKEINLAFFRAFLMQLHEATFLRVAALERNKWRLERKGNLNLLLPPVDPRLRLRRLLVKGFHRCHRAVPDLRWHITVNHLEEVEPASRSSHFFHDPRAAGQSRYWRGRQWGLDRAWTKRVLGGRRRGPSRQTLGSRLGIFELLELLGPVEALLMAVRGFLGDDPPAECVDRREMSNYINMNNILFLNL